MVFQMKTTLDSLYFIVYNLYRRHLLPTAHTGINLQSLSLQTTGSLGSLGSLSPALLTALTLKEYSCFSIRPFS